MAYARQLYGVDGLPAGSFDAQFTFAQALAEATRAVEGALLVVSIPASDIEVGGEGGRAALERLKNVIGRVESSWRPASAEEGFEIVRRRLFDDLPADKAPQRDAVVRAFGGLYRSQRGEFPGGCTEGDYERRLTAAYPIHPELFDRLYGEWSTLDKFQRTRGVLRLMAAVVHELWERNDPSLLIMPATIPIDAPAVSSELTRYLEEGWTPVIESDVDGPNALPLRLDRDNPNLGRYSATRRVARTIYLGSAPTQQAANRGLDDRSIKLGCVQPGEAPATFGDALRRLTDQATYLYVDGQRYWYSLQPSVTRLARDRAVSHFADDDVDEEIRRRRKPAERQRGDFAAVHAAPPPQATCPTTPRPDSSCSGPSTRTQGRPSTARPGWRPSSSSTSERRGTGSTATWKLVSEEGLITDYSGVRLRMDLDRVPLWRGDHVNLRQLWSDYSQYLYLPRLRDPAVLLGAVRDGVASLTWHPDTFAYASAFDEASGRYSGLVAAVFPAVTLDDVSVVVRPDVARHQIEADRKRADDTGGLVGLGEAVETSGGKVASGEAAGESAKPPEPVLPGRFYGRIALEPVRLLRDVSDITDAIVRQLRRAPDAHVSVTVEIEATSTGGFDDDVRRTVTENARTLRFDAHEFESE